MSDEAQPDVASVPQPRRRGRPKAESPGTSVSTWLRPQDHDRLIRLANRRETSVSALVRQLLHVKLR